MDGEIYIARGDGKGSDGINTYEMVHLRPLPNNDPAQPTSYIIEPVQCTVTGSATSYILHQTSQEQGAKLVKVSSSPGTARQVTQAHDDEGSQVSLFHALMIYVSPYVLLLPYMYQLTTVNSSECTQVLTMYPINNIS